LSNSQKPSSAELPTNQHRAISTLLSEPKICNAAKKAKVSEVTIFRWLKEEPFHRAYLEARRQATVQAIAQLQQAGGEALKTLCEVMKDKEVSASARVTAAKTVLELSIKSVELEDLAHCREAFRQIQRLLFRASDISGEARRSVEEKHLAD
jgi:hypothetical protein